MIDSVMALLTNLESRYYVGSDVFEAERQRIFRRRRASGTGGVHSI
ncbi:MAG TPA: hypothetical protein VK437_12630 [Steroidobacteraceae bacterium]|nr:hypothetical protein [Steroidobacteraceae bacterium]